MHFEVYKSGGGLFGAQSLITASQPWRWRLKAGNGEIMASGEGYSTKFNAERAIETLKTQIAAAPVRETAA